MQADHHIHILLDGADWRAAIAAHRGGPNEAVIRQRLQAYQAAGVTYLRDGGDRWGVCLLAAQLAPEYGIRYAAPGAPLCPTGRYGGFLGRSFAGCDEFRRLVAVNKQSGADFIKLILSGLMDFSSPGALTEPDLPRQVIADCIAIAHDAGLPVMVHCNGAAVCLAAIQAGADSLEHGAYLDDEALAALAESQTVWVPTLAPIGNLIGDGRYPDAALREILAAQQRRVHQAFLAGAKIACGSDAGAYRVPHGQALRDERRFLAQALEGLAWEDSLAASGQALQRVFAPARR